MELVGRPVRKSFEGFGTFAGIVDSYDPSAGYFKILYEDGDSEEVEFQEITAILNAMDIDDPHPPRLPDLNLAASVSHTTTYIDFTQTNGITFAGSVGTPQLKGRSLGRHSEQNASSESGAKRQKLSETVKKSSRRRSRAKQRPDTVPFAKEEEMEPVPVGPKPQLPPSSKDLDIEGLPVFDVFAVYSCLRSFSSLLFLSPFRLEMFVAALKYRYANCLIDSIHFSILQALKVHMESLLQEGSHLAISCLGNLNWELLDLVTWPVYLAEYLLIRGPAMKLDVKLTDLKLLTGEYYKQPAEVKLEILRCLCDDVVEVEPIRFELNRRMTKSQPNADSMDVGNKCEDSMAIDPGTSLAEDFLEETNDGNVDECYLCKMEGNLICCDGCPAAFHSRCVGVVKDRLPEGDWYCPECSMQKEDGLGKMSARFRGAEILGVDPHDRIYLGSCSYLLVFDSSGTDATYHFYNKTDRTVLNDLLLSNVSYNMIVSALSLYWGFPACSISHVGYNISHVHEQMSPRLPSPSKCNTDFHETSKVTCGHESSDVQDTAKPNLISNQLSGVACPIVSFGVSDEQKFPRVPSPSKHNVALACFTETRLEQKSASLKICGSESSEIPNTVEQNLTLNQLSWVSCPVVSFEISEDQKFPRAPSPSKHHVPLAGFMEKTSEGNCASPTNCGLESSEVPDTTKPNLTPDQLSGVTCPVVTSNIYNEQKFPRAPLPSKHDIALANFIEKTSEENCASPQKCGPENSEVPDTANPNLTPNQLSEVTCPAVNFGISDEHNFSRAPSPSKLDVTLTGFIEKTSEEKCGFQKDCGRESSEAPDTVDVNLMPKKLSGMTCPVVSFRTPDETTRAAICGNVQEPGIDCITDSSIIPRESGSANSYVQAHEREKYTEFSGWGCMPFPTDQRRIGSSELQYEPTCYVNCYYFGRIASAVADELLATSKTNNKETPMAVEDMKSEQLKAISRKSDKSWWHTYEKFSIDVKKERCGWCSPCQTSCETDCLFKVVDGNDLKGTEKQKVGLRSETNKKSHLGYAMHHILSIESRVHSLLSGPWQDLYYSKHWRKAVMKATDVASLKPLLLLLESNLRRVALSSEWLKSMDAAQMVGSAAHVFTSSSHASSNHSGSKRQAKKSLSASDSTKPDIYWWRGGRLSRQVFNWKMLPQSLTYKSGRQAGVQKISSILYPDSSEPNRSKWVAWRAAVENSRSVSQLICQVKDFESNIRWSEISNSQFSPQMSKEAKKWKKVIIRKKCIEGTCVKYLLDFGKREKLPAVISKQGVVEECSDARKKYWLNETHVPLNLVNAFEEKRLTRKLKRQVSGLLAEKGSKCENSKPIRVKGLSYLLSKEPKSHVCGQCNKDVLTREAINCQDCSGYFHRKHFRGPKDVPATTYICSKCKEKRGVIVNSMKEKPISVRSAKVPKASKEVSRGKPLGEIPKKIKVVFVRSVKAPDTNNEILGGMTLRKRSKKKKAVSKKKHHGARTSNRSKSKRKRSQNMDDTVTWPKKRRTVVQHTYWLNGILWANKPVDERGQQFREHKIVLPSQHIDDSLVPPVCCLCHEKYNSEVIYIGCESCKDWFHGDVLSLTLQNIDYILGFKCHKCRMKNIPRCPFLEKVTVTEDQLRQGHDAEMESMKVVNERSEVKPQDNAYEERPSKCHSEGSMNEKQREDSVAQGKVELFYKRRRRSRNRHIGVEPTARPEAVVAHENGIQTLVAPQEMGDTFAIPELPVAGTLADSLESHTHTILLKPQKGEIP